MSDTASLAIGILSILLGVATLIQGNPLGAAIVVVGIVAMAKAKD